MTNGLPVVAKPGVSAGAENTSAAGNRLLSCGRSCSDTTHTKSKISFMGDSSMAFTRYDQCEYCFQKELGKQDLDIKVRCALKILSEQIKNELRGTEIPNRTCSLFSPLPICEDDEDLFVDEVI